MLGRQHYQDQIPRWLGWNPYAQYHGRDQALTVANKTGELDGIRADAGLVRHRERGTVAVVGLHRRRRGPPRDRRRRGLARGRRVLRGDRGPPARPRHLISWEHGGDGERTGETMSVAIARYENLIGGEWVDAVDGGTEQIVNPATGETIAEVPRGTEADVERAVKAAKDALPAWLETTPGRAGRDAPGARRRGGGACGRARPGGVSERRQADGALEVRARQVRGQPALLRRCGALPRRPGGRRVPCGVHVDGPPRADRRRRPDRAVELPAHDGDLEDRPCPGGGQRLCPQAVGADAADDAHARGLRARRSSRRAS